MIVIHGLTKVYKLNKRQKAKLKAKSNIKRAADNISLIANEGEIYGLLGPNGAGKTTVLRCIATLLTPTEGDISVCGYDTIKDSQKVRESIGFLTNEIKLDGHFSAKYLFDFFGRLYQVPEAEIINRRRKLFNYFGITEFQNKTIEELSTGMKQKAAIAISLVHNPKVIIFDEPTSGLDIVTARHVTDYLKVLKEEGKTVLISTHIMSEAEKLCDRIGIIISGQKVIEGTLTQILKETKANDLEDAFFTLYQKYQKEEP